MFRRVGQRFALRQGWPDLVFPKGIGHGQRVRGRFDSAGIEFVELGKIGQDHVELGGHGPQLILAQMQSCQMGDMLHLALCNFHRFTVTGILG
jgi:hypothetical protein